ncbi:MAG: NAD-dependent epimerase/dehydratase family protein, partial [Acidobacteriaceae bacterium]|jgi:nucleoside-diphosphate-sugar epimerase|nr:NAD-dependent epimerase/dehydratase family protein [Acidobacteriaceae bacterium]
VTAPLTADPLREAFRGSALVVHCAGIVRAASERGFAAVNIDGTRAAVEAANTVGARFVQISSLAAGGTGTAHRPRREGDPDRPVNAYGRSKLAGDRLVRSLAKTPWTIIRPCAVYGPGDRGFLPLFQAARRGIFVSPTSRAVPFSFIDVRDLARAIVAAAVSDAALGQTFYVGHPVPRTSDDVITTLAAIFDTPARRWTIPRPLVYAAARLGDLAWKVNRPLVIDSSRYQELFAEGFVCSSEAIRDRVGFVAEVSLADGFAHARRWYEAQGWL